MRQKKNSNNIACVLTVAQLILEFWGQYQYLADEELKNQLVSALRGQTM